MKFPYEDFHYLKARSLDDKRPAESWGGYSTDLAENSKVYDHNAVEQFPHEAWLINGVHNSDSMKHQLLVFDLDIYKAPESFNSERVEVPENTPIVKSQSGGIHVYFAVSSPARGQESDFHIESHVPFDIDVRGEFVKHHVVAPSDIPGVNGGYEVVNDADLSYVFDPAEAAEAITVDGDPAIRYEPGNVSRGSGYEREDVDPPDELPKCYGAGLELRKKAPDDPDLNTHKVNVLTALAGLASGYDVDTVVGHFVDEYYPGNPGEADKERTQYQVEHIARKLDAGDYDPPAIGSLQQYGMLPVGESCSCGLPGHTVGNDDTSPYYDVDLSTIALNNDLRGDPYRDTSVMLKACLLAREQFPGLSDAKPPYKALIGVAESVGLDMADPDERILGETTYNVARRIYDDLEPSDV